MNGKCLLNRNYGGFVYSCLRYSVCKCANDLQDIDCVSNILSIHCTVKQVLDWYSVSTNTMSNLFSLLVRINTHSYTDQMVSGLVISFFYEYALCLQQFHIMSNNTLLLLIIWVFFHLETHGFLINFSLIIWYIDFLMTTYIFNVYVC